MGTKNFMMFKSHFVYEFVYVNMHRLLVSSLFLVVYVFQSMFKATINRIAVRDQNRDEDESEGTGSSCDQDSETQKYEFMAGKGVVVGEFMEEPRTMNVTVHEVFEYAKNGGGKEPESLDLGGSRDKDLQEVELNDLDRSDSIKNSETEEVLQSNDHEVLINEKLKSEAKESENLDPGGSTDEDFQEVESSNEEEEPVERLGEMKDELDEDGDGDYNDISNVHASIKNSETEEVLRPNDHEVLINENSCEDETIDSDERSERNCKGGFSDSMIQQESSVKATERIARMPVNAACDARKLDSFDIDSDSDEHYEKDSSSYDFFSERFEQESSQGTMDDDDQEECDQEQDPEFKRNSQNQSSDSEEEYIDLEPQMQNSVSAEDSIKFTVKCEMKYEDDTDYIMEHEEIIEQLKLELRNARTGGLPTIEEEPETEEAQTPTMVQVLKPLNIEEKLEYKDFVEEIHKVYKSYLDKMKKLDVLNCQNMHALGLVQLKQGGDNSRARRKSSIPVIKSIIYQSLWSCKGIAVIESTKKIFAEMNWDFMIVYVGQVSLSWEILLWQYWKIQEIDRYDSKECHSFNRAAGEFQLFQVLLQRFMENEPYQGPYRVQNYGKNRCVLPSLLQVPLVKDDNLYEMKGDREEAVTSQMLTKTIEESMHVFGEFLRSDKDHYQQQQISVKFQVLQDNSELFMETLTNFQKKEKKLRDILRSGNCIVKKLQKQQEDTRSEALLIAQVNLKLVSKVLNMSNLTRDQLIWCHEKLEKININNRKIFIEHSFLPFPC